MGLNDHIKKARIQAAANNASFGVSTDLAQVNKDAWNFIMDVDGVNDDGWKQAFKKVPSGENGSWEIHTGTNGVKLQQRAEGEKLDIRTLSTEKDTVYVYKYGEAIGITDEMIRFRKVAKMLDLFEAAREAYLIGVSTNFYTLLKTAAANNVTTYQGVADDGQLQRDIQTINQAAKNIGNRMKTKISNAANIPLIMYVNPDDEDRTEAAFRVTTASLATAGRTGGQVTGRRITRIYTYNVDQGSPILLVPGRKTQWAEAMPLTQYTKDDILIFAYIQAYWTYFGGAVGDTDQIEEITLG